MNVSTRDTHYTDLAALLSYPGDPGYKESVDYALEGLRSRKASLGELLAPFGKFVASHSVEELEECYTRTFDINPDCTLEVGWQLYGENYSRGKLLVTMRGLMRELGLEESSELPDHLTHVLAIMSRQEEEQQQEAARGLASNYVLPALVKMRQGLPSDNVEKPHGLVLEAIEIALREIHSLPADGSSFLELNVLPPGIAEATEPYDMT